MKVRQIISLIERDGWQRVYAKGGHRQYKHPSKKGRVTIAGQAGDEVHPKTLNSILKQAGLK
jgi:predicted RNA binding protein YcfA (HicA-like mRNA interferase family)